MDQSKKPRKTRSRSSSSSRAKSSNAESRFGIRYLHHHMFTGDTPPEAEKLCPHECKCGTSMSSLYSGKTLVLLTLSILILLIGVTFMLVGYLIPRRSVVYLEKSDGSRTVVDPTAINFNTMLDDFTLVGTALVPLGALMFCVILIIPVCRSSPSHKKGQYVKAPTDEYSTASLATKTKTPQKNASMASEDIRSLSSASSSTIQKIPVLALVHNVQPEQKAESVAGSLGKTGEFRKKTGKWKNSFDEEEEE